MSKTLPPCYRQGCEHAGKYRVAPVGQPERAVESCGRHIGAATDRALSLSTRQQGERVQTTLTEPTW